MREESVRNAYLGDVQLEGGKYEAVGAADGSLLSVDHGTDLEVR